MSHGIKPSIEKHSFMWRCWFSKDKFIKKTLTALQFIESQRCESNFMDGWVDLEHKVSLKFIYIPLHEHICYGHIIYAMDILSIDVYIENIKHFSIGLKVDFEVGMGITIFKIKLLRFLVFSSKLLHTWSRNFFLLSP